MDILKPRDHAEEIAIFRHGMIGQLCARDLEHGDLVEALRALSKERVRPPGSSCTRTFAVPTLERWLYAYRQRGLEGLCPRARRDRGRGRELDPVLRRLLCDIRREHPDASVPLILRTLRADGRLSATVSASTVRRLFRQEGLDKIPQRDGKGPTTRLKWQAERPDALWHGDVCHGPTLHLDGRRVTVRIHALLDDASRFIVILSVESDEKEDTLLRLLVRALRLYGVPDALYLDNGATYRGDALRLFCSRLGITLLHARPYDPQARGKMERFWRTLRENVLDHLGSVTSLQDISSRIQAFLDVHYHPSPHAGLMGRAPGLVYAPGQREIDALSEARLREALTLRQRRRVRRDTTVALRGQLFELDHGYLAGRVVTVAYCLLDEPLAPVVELEGQRIPLRPVDPVHNAHVKRPARRATSGGASAAGQPVAFDPGGALLVKSARDAALATGADEADGEEDLDAIF
ncbi:DDE-type integrase/transposase/recombinase [Sorangium sp. So ce1335]|uniref:DDE-type integrase/transposase/recombinase n=1 Tax=Sorangium sp. So ce1335 TaxID=3133335 RepID=UPI003F5F1EB0